MPTTPGSRESGSETTMSEELDCEHVLARAYEFFDHELDDATGEEIRAHLAACEPCLEHFDVEQAVRAMLRRHCAQSRAPEGLRLRIVSQLTLTRVEDDGTQIVAHRRIETWGN